MLLPALVLLAAVAVSASTLKPPVLPLFVRTPYLSTWLPNARDAPWEHWPIFWTGQKTGLSVMASVPKTKAIYPLLGRPHDSLPVALRSGIAMPIYEGSSFDASTTNLTYRLGPDDSIKVTLSFLSPITPSSTLRQSVPAGYMAVYLEGTLDVNIYTDVSGEWVSGKVDSSIEWQLQETSADIGSLPIKSWSVWRRKQLLFTESSDKAEWGTFQFTAPHAARHQSGKSTDVRLQFARHGCLDGDNDYHFRPINFSEPVFAFSMSFDLSGEGTGRKSSQKSVVFTLALVQDPVVQFAAARGLTCMRPLWASYFSGALDMLDWHHADFTEASRQAHHYSQQLRVDAAKSCMSQSYGDIVSLSARQVLGATQFSGTPDSPLLFLKEISSNGNFQTVDVIFPAFPFFLYTNPRWLVYLLEPLFEHQLSGQYPNDYSMHDLGLHFPNATGHADGKDEYMPVEECGNMLIMALALANAIRDRDDSNSAWSLPSKPHRRPWGHQNFVEAATKGGLSPLDVDEFGIDWLSVFNASNGEKPAKAWVKRSYSLLRQWTGYLVRESLIPRNQLSTDDFAGWLANQTNLALKGIVGIRAMSDLSKLVGNDEDANHYRDVASSYVDKWLDYGLSRDKTHAKLSYTWYGSWTTLYNLFADSLLCFGETEGSKPPTGGKGEDAPVPGAAGSLVPRRVYSMQSSWYGAVLQRYGLPLDSRHLYAKSDWQFFAAAVAGKKTRQGITESIALWVNETVTDRPLTDLYDTEGQGDFSPARFMARPVVGGHFARLALLRACGGTAVERLSFLDVDEAETPLRETKKAPWKDGMGTSLEL